MSLPRRCIAGADGLNDYRRDRTEVLDFAPGGVACMEIGATQAGQAGFCAVCTARGFAVVSAMRDLAGLRPLPLVITR